MPSARAVFSATLTSLCILVLTFGVVLATHTTGYRNGTLGECCRQGYIYSRASNYIDHFWKNLGFTWWYNSVNTYRSNYVPTPTWWTVEWDHSMTSAGTACTS